MKRIYFLRLVATIAATGLIVLCIWQLRYKSLLPWIKTKQDNMVQDWRFMRAKNIFKFEEHEKTAPSYQKLVTNWNPVFITCGGITNIKMTSHFKTEQAYRGFLGANQEKWIDVVFTTFPSSRAAHEYLIQYLSNPVDPKGLSAGIETTDPDKIIGYRCFRGKGGFGEDIKFIRNNVFLRIHGHAVEVDVLARDLDRQIIKESN